MSSRSKNCAPGSLLEANSCRALRGVLGMNQVASSSLTKGFFDWIRACAWDGESTRGVDEEEDMALRVIAEGRNGRKKLNMIVTAANTRGS